MGSSSKSLREASSQITTQQKCFLFLENPPAWFGQWGYIEGISTQPHKCTCEDIICVSSRFPLLSSLTSITTTISALCLLILLAPPPPPPPPFPRALAQTNTLRGAPRSISADTHDLRPHIAGYIQACTPYICYTPPHIPNPR
ncbi:hypothetical protein K440DRAFT_83173 [Wilcoxina mikolae CBS 423.85]|nr:hypothetical protein K440DRAFT_83173 [Wilcoxina mikolae CBS 423.85]